MKKIILSLIFSLMCQTAHADATFVPSQASEIETSTTDFNNNLSSSDTTVQKALDTLDNMAVGSGDSITVNSTAATNANFLDNIYTDWAIDTAATPDDITSKFNYNAASGDLALSANELAFALNGFVAEGATADTIELYFAFPDPVTTDKTITFPNATDTLVGKATTDTLTNKTLAAADNVIAADTAVALAANGTNCSASNAPLGVDASGAAESCTDFEEELTNSAGLLAALDDETGTGVAVFGTDPAITAPAISGTPNAAGELGYNTTQKMQTTYGGATAAAVPMHTTIASGVGTQTFINDVATDQDFSSMYTFPANSIYTNKVFRVSVVAETVTGVSTVTINPYLKIGSTKVYTITNSTNIANSTTKTFLFSWLIFGRADAGASANVTTAPFFTFVNGGEANSVDQPVALATNGTLTINFGITYSGTGSTESIEQQGYVIEELN